jgi:hypothetical protein
MKWKGKKSGDLLRAAEREFDVFVTVAKASLGSRRSPAGNSR